MSESVFPKGHYSTGSQLGVRGEFSDFGLIAAELELTLPIVEKASPGVKFGPEELTAYHNLHYGESLPPATIALDLIRSGEHPEWFQPEEVHEKTSTLAERIERMTGKEGLRVPVPLGRIAIGYDAEVCEDLRDLTRRLSFGFGPNGRRMGRFLYPRGDVSLSYTGNHKQSKELQEFLKEQRKVDPMAHSLELNDIIAKKDSGETQGFVAISGSLGLKKIVPKIK